MGRYISLLLFIGLAFWGCEEDEPEDCAGVAGGDNICGCTDSTATNYDSTATFDDESCEYDTTPPTVTITFPQNNSSVSEMVSITCISSDNEGVEKVELWVNGVNTGLTDNTEPYSFEWNTTTLDNGNYTIIIRSYDTSGNTTDSESITLIVDKTVELWGVNYSIENLTSLILYHNQLTGSIPPEIGNLTNLTTLVLYHNELTGEIPPEIGNLTNLIYLALHENQLTGSIPPEIGNLTNLRQLSLDFNQLTGSIPSEIGNLTNLDFLKLNNNQLTGEIPESICDLNINFFSSDYFTIYNNQLCPPYPSCIEDYVGEQDTTNCD
jgi:Leucine-rich repeat (LRR) protein